jgi:hypothetical protein
MTNETPSTLKGNCGGRIFDPRPVIAALLLLGNLSCSGTRVDATAPGCCQSGLLDATKLLPANLPDAPAHRNVSTVIWCSPHVCDLSSYLAAGVAKSVRWYANGTRLSGHMMDYGDSPAENHIRQFAVRTEAAGGRERSDGFILVIIPPATLANYENWLKRERADLSWLKELPPVYSALGDSAGGPEPGNCRTKYWRNVERIHDQFHPGGAFEMRSFATAHGHGHQAVYGTDRKLIREGPGRGSADKSDPVFPGFGVLQHVSWDVRPFVWAAQLDGNPVNPKLFYEDLDGPLIRASEHIDAYFSVRPALVGTTPEVAPGTCIE